MLDRIFVQGVQYKRAGVIVMGISPNNPNCVTTGVKIVMDSFSDSYAIEG